MQAGKNIETKEGSARNRRNLIPGSQRMALVQKGDGEEEGFCRRFSARTEVKSSREGGTVAAASDQPRSSHPE